MSILSVVQNKNKEHNLNIFKKKEEILEEGELFSPVREDRKSSNALNLKYLKNT